MFIPACCDCLFCFFGIKNVVECHICIAQLICREMHNSYFMHVLKEFLILLLVFDGLLIAFQAYLLATGKKRMRPQRISNQCQRKNGYQKRHTQALLLFVIRYFMPTHKFYNTNTQPHQLVKTVYALCQIFHCRPVFPCTFDSRSN